MVAKVKKPNQASPRSPRLPLNSWPHPQGSRYVPRGHLVFPAWRVSCLFRELVLAFLRDPRLAPFTGRLESDLRDAATFAGPEQVAKKRCVDSTGRLAPLFAHAVCASNFIFGPRTAAAAAAPCCIGRQR